ncbi:MAG: VanZ family protein [Acidobacteria bacterium]|nr:VanZ family protein [Acidobacteriota bacterium]
MANSSIKSGNPQSAFRNPKSKLFYWLPPILWLAAIFYFSTDSFSGEHTGSLLYSIAHWIFPSLTVEQFQPIHFVIRKMAHFTEYGILALILFRAFRSGDITRWHWRWALFSWLIVVVYALLDEFHQTFVASRTPSIVDSMIDSLGGMTALLILWLSRRND